MLHVVLYRPQIPANTGNISRTCAVTGVRLHLIEKMGFSIDDKKLKRAGLDYWPILDLEVHASFEDFYHKYRALPIYAITKYGSLSYSDITYPEDCCFLFGMETTGLPLEIKELFKESLLRIPMRDEPLCRSLNLSNSVSIVLYEALRQRGFSGLF